jgi:hypothetical protein
MGGIADLVGGIIGGATNIFGAKQGKDSNDQMRQEDKDWYAQQYAQALRANRANQNTPFGSTKWSVDKDGNWTQDTTLDEASQGRLNKFNGIADKRMDAAGGIDLSYLSHAPDWGSLGLGAQAQAAGLGGGSQALPANQQNPMLQGTNPYVQGNAANPMPQPMPGGPGGGAPGGPGGSMGGNGAPAPGPIAAPAPVPQPAPAPGPTPAPTAPPVAQPSMEGMDIKQLLALLMEEYAKQQPNGQQ